jgi:CubicO group peptidase (beta-lactamase class C family)
VRRHTAFDQNQDDQHLWQARRLLPPAGERNLNPTWRLHTTFICSPGILGAFDLMNFGKIRQHIRDARKERGIPSLALAVAKDGEILWEDGFGWSNRETRARSDAHTSYSLASISKPITATALMTLVEKGLVDLDAPINEYLGDAKLTAHVGVATDSQGGLSQKEAADQATVRRVANHTSGLPLHYQFFHDNEPWRRPPMDLSILRYGHLVRIPGERYVYANFGFGLIDYIIERVSGKPFATFLKQEVFDPLGMTRSAVGIGPNLGPYAAERYDLEGKPISFYDFDHPGASAVYCSAHDLVRFGLLHSKSLRIDQRSILSDESIDAMQVATSGDDPSEGYGIGWRIIADNCGYRTVNHDGSMGGVRTRLILVPEENLVVAVLCNASTNLPVKIADMILSECLPGYGTPPPKPRDNDALDEKPPFVPHPALEGLWRGKVNTYSGDIPIEINIPETGPYLVRLGAGLQAVLDSPTFEDDRLTGSALGDIETDDAQKRPYTLAFDLNLRWNVLNGSVTAKSNPGPKLGNALSHWCELEKAP